MSDSHGLGGAREIRGDDNERTNGNGCKKRTRQSYPLLNRKQLYPKNLTPTNKRQKMESSSDNFLPHSSLSPTDETSRSQSPEMFATQPNIQIISQQSLVQYDLTTVNLTKQPSHSHYSLDANGSQESSILVDIHRIQNTSQSSPQTWSSGVQTRLMSANYSQFTQNRTLATQLLMEAWRLSGSSDDVCKYLQPIDNDGDMAYNPLIRFLQGDTEMYTTLEEFMAYLTTGPEKIVGRFIVALMIMEYLACLDVRSLIDLYEKLLPLHHSFRIVFEKMLLYKIQRGMRCDKMGFQFIENCPPSLWSDLNCDMINNSEETNAMLANEKICPQAWQESIHLDKLFQWLQQLIFTDMQTDSIKLLGPGSHTFKTAQVWSILLLSRIRQVAVGRRRGQSALQMLVYMLRDEHTLTYFYFPKDKRQEPMRLNPTVMGVWGSIPESSCALSVVEDESTIRTFVEAVYDVGDEMPLEKRLTLGIYRLAQQIGISDVYGFMFRGKSWQQVEDTSKIQVLQVLIHLDRSDELDEIAATIDTWMPEEEKSGILNGLSAEQVVNFMGRKSLKMKEDEVYGLLIKWACESCGREFSSLQNTRYDEEVYEKFKLVRRALFLMEIENFAILIRHRFVSFEDIFLAKSLREEIITDLSSNPDECWFSVGYRKK